MKNLTLKFCLVAFFALAAIAQAQQPAQLPTPAPSTPQPVLKTLQLDSKLMVRQMPYCVILPANYDTDKDTRFPVVYMLHGLGGSYKVTKLSSAKYTDQQRVIMVFVEGGTGFYTDSAAKPNDKYETYVTNELIPEVDKNFRTLAKRGGRAVAGVSMGGYGALKYGIKYPQLFSLAVSWSGAANVTSFHEARTFPPIPGIKETLTSVFGERADSPTITANDLFKLFAEFPAERLKELPFFYLDCGSEDELGLYKPNHDLAQLMITRKIPHEYREYPGGHGVWRSTQWRDFYELSDRIFAKQKAASSIK